MEGFLSTHDLLMVNQDELDLHNINGLIICSDAEEKKFQVRKLQGKMESM